MSFLFIPNSALIVTTGMVTLVKAPPSNASYRQCLTFHRRTVRNVGFKPPCFSNAMLRDLVPNLSLVKLFIETLASVYYNAPGCLPTDPQIKA